MKTFEQWIQEAEQLPWHLVGKWGTRFFGTFGLFADLARASVYYATRARYVSKAPSDALPHAVRDANVPTFVAFDTEGAVRARVGDAWGWHARQGTEPGYDEVLALLKLDPDETWVLDSSNGPHWFTESWYSAFAIASRNPLGWGPRTETWDELEARGITWAEWEALGECWDYTCPASLFSQLREWMWERKWVHGIPAYAVISFGPGHTWDSLAGAGVTWDDLEAAGTTWDELADATAVVIQTARFWNALNLEDGNAPLTWDQLEAMGVRWGRCMTRRD